MRKNRKSPTIILVVLLIILFAVRMLVKDADAPASSTLTEITDTAGDETKAGDGGENAGDSVTSAYTFRTPELRLSHFTKHGIDMGFTTEEAYEEAASRVVTNPSALHKTEAEDGDDVYYIEDTNEFVVLSTDGYIRTYFNPDNGKAYFDKQ